MDQQLNWEGGFLYQFLTISCISFLAKVSFPNMITYKFCLTLCLSHRLGTQNLGLKREFQRENIYVYLWLIHVEA